MLKIDLPTPGAAEMREFNRDQNAVRTALTIKTDLIRAIQRLRPFTIAALARQYFPGESDFHALAKFGLELTATLRELAEHGEDCKNILLAADAKSGPLVAAATRRHFEIIGEALPRIDCEIASHERRAQEKRKALEGAGVAGDDLERLAGDDGIGGLIAEKAALAVENDDLVRFMKTQDERHLPPGFKAVAPRSEPAAWTTISADRGAMQHTA